MQEPPLEDDKEYIKTAKEYVEGMRKRASINQERLKECLAKIEEDIREDLKLPGVLE